MKDTAILLFSRTAAAEAEVKKLAWSKKATEKVAAVMINHTNKVVADTEIPYFIYTEAEQKGRSFGERLGNAIEEVFCKGFQKVLVLGNDCLNLASSDLLQAADTLNHCPTLLGPTKDGGVYVMGFQRAAFDKAAFVKIAWQTERVFDELLALFTAAEILSTEQDIDSFRDLKIALKTISGKLLKQLMDAIHVDARSLRPASEKALTSYRYSFRSLRAPPVL